MSVTILHLTDIHAGPGELKDEDLKQKIPGVEREKMLDRLTKYLKSLSAIPDFLVVTGDLTIRGNEEGFDAFRSWVEKRIGEGILPHYNRIIVVPGNHDVKWKVQQKPGWHKERYRLFSEKIAKVFPHAYIPESDPAPDSAKLNFAKNSIKLIGGIITKKKLDRVEITSSWPFLLDLQKDILIFAFNSTLGCGVYLPASDTVIKPLNALLGYYAGKQIEGKLKEIQEGYQESLLVDAGFVGDEQLNYFSEIMNKLKSKLGAKYSRLTKIALLHHHVSHLWQQQLEVKNFETVLDAAQLKQRLIEYEFDIVLHGHKHTNHVALDGSVIPLNSSKQFSPLCISSGGTISGYPRLSDRQTFKLLSFDEDSGPRTKATITEIPLLDADPQFVMKSEAKIYPVPISSRLPELHDLGHLKQKADDFIRDHCALELNDPRNIILPGGEFQIPTANPDLISGASRYTCYRILESQYERVFYDIFLATKELGFRQKARIYWMLNDVKSLEKSSDKKCKVVVMIGNLEETHFFQGHRKDEVKESITKIKEEFDPACQIGLLEVRVHVFSQDEVEKLIRSS